MYPCDWMARERVLNGLSALASLSLAIALIWGLIGGWDGMPRAVGIAGLAGAVTVMVESVWGLIRRRNDPDREFR